MSRCQTPLLQDTLIAFFKASESEIKNILDLMFFLIIRGWD